MNTVIVPFEVFQQLNSNHRTNHLITAYVHILKTVQKNNKPILVCDFVKSSSMPEFILIKDLEMLATLGIIRYRYFTHNSTSCFIQFTKVEGWDIPAESEKNE